jgi:hypothetical protein
MFTISRYGYRLYLVLYRPISTVPEGEKIGEAVGISKKECMSRDRRQFYINKKILNLLKVNHRYDCHCPKRARSARMPGSIGEQVQQVRNLKTKRMLQLMEG